MILTERYRHQLPRGGASAACTSGDPGDHDPLACAAACGMKLQPRPSWASPPSLPPRQAPRSYPNATASTWGIENGLHHRRDTTLSEDASRIRFGQAPAYSPPSGNVVISVLNRATPGNHAAARRHLGWTAPAPGHSRYSASENETRRVRPAARVAKRRRENHFTGSAPPRYRRHTITTWAKRG